VRPIGFVGQLLESLRRVGAVSLVGGVAFIAVIIGGAAAAKLVLNPQATDGVLGLAYILISGSESSGLCVVARSIGGHPTNGRPAGSSGLQPELRRRVIAPQDPLTEVAPHATSPVRS
jgi:hypothetical protein